MLNDDLQVSVQTESKGMFPTNMESFWSVSIKHHYLSLLV